MEQRDMRGSLFVNDKKQSANQPDYKGSIVIEGRRYWLSGWAQTSQSGIQYLSLSAQADEQYQPQQAQGPQGFPQAFAPQPVQQSYPQPAQQSYPQRQGRPQQDYSALIQQQRNVAPVQQAPAPGPDGDLPF